MEDKIKEIVKADINDFSSPCLFKMCDKYNRDCDLCKTAQLNDLFGQETKELKSLLLETAKGVEELRQELREQKVGEEVEKPPEEFVKDITEEANRKYKKEYPTSGDDHFKEWDMKWILEIIYEKLGGNLAD